MELNPQVKSTVDSVLAEFVDLKQRCPRMYHLGTVAEFEEAKVRYNLTDDDIINTFCERRKI